MANQVDEQVELPQLGNAVLIVGTLAKMNLEAKTSAKGNDMIIGTLTVEVNLEVDGVMRKNEIQVKVLAMKTSKLYKGCKTVMDEYKSKESVRGDEKPDRIQVSGNIALEEWSNDKGTISFNSIKGVYFNRLDEGTDEYNAPDKSQYSVDCIFGSILQKLDSDQLPTGEYQVKAFTVGYGSEIIPIQNMILAESLLEGAQAVYYAGCTATFSGNILNYSEDVVTETEAPQVQFAFGSQNDADKKKQKPPKDYISRYTLESGTMPMLEGAYSDEQVAQAAKLRAIKLSELKNPTPNKPPAAKTPPKGMAFGTAPEGITPPIEDDEDIPF